MGPPARRREAASAGAGLGARAQGVHLTEDYRIIDEQSGQTWDDSLRRLQPMTPQEIAQLRSWSPEQMARRVVRFATLAWSSQALLDATLPGCGAALAPVIGLGITQDRDHEAPVANAHGFSLEWLRIPPGGPKARRIEHRVAGSDANPYLVLAAVLAGGGQRLGGLGGHPVTVIRGRGTRLGFPAIGQSG